jgi:hypothetical protein
VIWICGKVTDFQVAGSTLRLVASTRDYPKQHFRKNWDIYELKMSVSRVVAIQPELQEK